MSRPPLPRQKMSAKKKGSAIIALFLTLALAMGGAFAWTDFSQFFINRFRGGASPDALLHDDFTPNVNKDVYVENPGTQPIIVRVMFKEFFQVGNDITKDANEKTPNSNDQDTWPTVLLDANGPTNSIASTYYKWTMGGLQKVYLPGTSAWGDEDYSGKAVNTEGVTGPNGQMFQKTLDSSTILTMKEWIDLGEVERANSPARWIVDEDGWAYWSQLLLPNTATNLLLDKVTTVDNAVPEDNYFYAIDVIMEATNKTDVSKFDKSEGTKAYDYILKSLSNSESTRSPFSIEILDGDENMDPGEGQQFEIAGDGTPDGVEWSVVDETVIGDGKKKDATTDLFIDNAGYLSVPLNRTGGTITVKAMVTFGDAKYPLEYKKKITVSGTAVNLDDFTVALPNDGINLFLGETEVDLAKYVTYSDTTKKPSKYLVAWSVAPVEAAQGLKHDTGITQAGLLTLDKDEDLYNAGGDTPTLWGGLNVTATLNGVSKTTTVKYGNGRTFAMDGENWRAIRKTVVDGKAYYLAVKSAALPTLMTFGTTNVYKHPTDSAQDSNAKKAIDAWFASAGTETKANAVAHNALEKIGVFKDETGLDNRTEMSGFSAPLTSGDATAFALSTQEMSRYLSALYYENKVWKTRNTDDDPVYQNWNRLSDKTASSWGRTPAIGDGNVSWMGSNGAGTYIATTENFQVRPALWVKADWVDTQPVPAADYEPQR